MISVTDVVEYCFCPKFVYFSMVLGLPQFEEKRGTVLSGRKMHKKYERTNTQYKIKSLQNAKKITEAKLYSKKYGYVGIVDQAYTTDKDIVLIERKNTDSNVLWPTIMAQIGLLSILLEENYSLPVSECIVVFSKTRRSVKHIMVTSAIKDDALDKLRKTRDVINTCESPDALYSAKCDHCCYRSVCPVGSFYTSK